MFNSLRALCLVGVAFVGLWYFAGGTRTLPVAVASATVAEPLRHENLSVYFVHGSDAVADAKVMTLQEALDRELAVVHETSDVNTLAVENRSPDCELFIQSGDIVKGGKQDRMAATDMLLPPGSGRVALPAHCVEQGRWTNRGTEDAKRFNKSDGFAVGNALKYANASGQQNIVWQTVSDNQGKLRMNVAANVTENASPTSFQLTLEAPAVKAKVAEYEAALKAAGDNRWNVVGVVFVVNGQITGAEVYGSNALFRKAWPKLLNAAAVEAVAERTDKPTAPPPTAREIEYFLARAADPEPTGTGASNESRSQTTRLRDVYGVRGTAINANDEIFQTEGRAPQTEGRVVIEGDVETIDRVLTDQLDLRPGQPIPRPNTPPGVNPIGSALTPPSTPRATVTASPILGFAEPTPPANAAGNRLNSNRTENRSTLMVESRDPNRQNAVIHRSYIKK